MMRKFEFPYVVGEFMIDKLYVKYPEESLETIEDAVNEILYRFAEEEGHFPDIENARDCAKVEADTVQFLGILVS